MDTSRFSTTRAEIAILDFHATMAWRNFAAISFLLGRFGDSLTFPELSRPMPVGDHAVFNCFGWLDVVHPCLDHIKARLRVNVGSETLDHSMRLELISTVLEALHIPRDETYEADFFSVIGHTSIHQTVDRDGMTDRI